MLFYGGPVVHFSPLADGGDPICPQRDGGAESSSRDLTQVDCGDCLRAVQSPYDETETIYGDSLPHGRCDTCGAPCSQYGCSADHTHLVAVY